jgi:integrase
MALDFRYMKLGRGPGSTWFFVYNIPQQLRSHPRFQTRRGKPMGKITESLGTRDSDKARELRNARLVYWDRQFRMLAQGPSEDDVREETIEVFRATLKAQKEREANPSEEWAEFLQDGKPAGWFRDGEPVPYEAILDDAIEEQVAQEITDYCKRTNAMLTPGTEAYRKVGTQFIKAKIAAGDWESWFPLPDGRSISGHHQNLPPLPKIEPPIPGGAKPIYAPPNKNGETFSGAFEQYTQTELDGTSANTITEYGRKVKIFIDKIGDLPLGQITDNMAVEFLDGYLLGERKVSARTRNQYSTLLAAIFKCAIRRKKATGNPFEGQQIKMATVHYEPFTNQEIATIFADAKFEIAPAKHSTLTALPWACLISAYSGCRLEEAAQLKAADIKRTDNIWHFDFCANGNGKTKAATRVVPIHHAIIGAGFLKYRDALPAGSGLFPGLKGRASKGGKLGPKIGDAFNAWRKRLGITRDGINFHSFRHSVGHRLDKAGVPESDRAAVLGHEHPHITSGTYSHRGPGLRRLKGIVEKIDYGQ